MRLLVRQDSDDVVGRGEGKAEPLFSYFSSARAHGRMEERKIQVESMTLAMVAWAGNWGFLV